MRRERLIREQEERRNVFLSKRGKINEGNIEEREERFVFGLEPNHPWLLCSRTEEVWKFQALVFTFGFWVGAKSSLVSLFVNRRGLGIPGTGSLRLSVRFGYGCFLFWNHDGHSVLRTDEA